MTAPDSIRDWVAAASDQKSRELRQAVHTVLAAIALAPTLPKECVMKGGILLALQYHGDRFTRDIDFSTTKTVADLNTARVRAELDQALSTAVESLDYGLDCRIQSSELKPPGPEASWPTFTMKVGYAPKAEPNRHRHLVRGQTTDVLSIDLSYNEVITAIEWLDIPGGGEIAASTLADVIAEKFRAMIQQPIRNRTRRQDLYDIFRLLERPEISHESTRKQVLKALREKAESRGIEVTRTTLGDPAIAERSKAEYDRVQQEILSELPEFDHAYRVVSNYYENLPWN